MGLIRKGQKVSIIEWVYDKDSDKAYIREIGKNKGIKYDREKDNFYVKFKNSKIPIKHNYIKNSKFFSVINVENSFVPVDSDFNIQIKEMDVMTEARRKIIENQLKEKGIDFDEGTIKKLTSEKKEALLKLCAMPMDVRSWHIINTKQLASRGEGFFAKYGSFIYMFFFLVFAIAYPVAVTEMLGERAESSAVAGAREGIETYWDNVKPLIKSVNLTIESAPSGDILTTTTIPDFQPP